VERIASIFTVERAVNQREQVAYSPSLLVLIQLVVSDWWLSLQPPAHAGSPLADFSTMKMEAIRSSETSVNARSTQRHIPEDDILQEAGWPLFESQ
jgi:hypothetical protein